MSTNTIASKPALVSLCNALVTGITAMPDKTFQLGGQSYTKAQVLAPLQAYVDANGKTTADEATWHQSVQEEHDAEASARAMIDALKPFLQGRLGKSSPMLQSQYGLAPAKKPAKTVAAKAAGIAKSQATRELRGTRGSKQKKALTAAAVQPAAPALQPVTPALPSPAPATQPGALPAAPSTTPKSGS